MAEANSIARDTGPDISMRRELEDLRKQVRQMEQDNRMLLIMHQNSEHLRRSGEMEKRLQYLYNDLLLEYCPNMIYLFNTQLCLELCSRACQPFLSEVHSGDRKGMPFREVFSSKLEIRWVEQVLCQNQEVMETLSCCRYQDTIRFSDGKHIHAQISISPVVDEAGTCRGSIMTVNDITELMRTKLKAEAASRSKSSFLANMSHEIRTPINAVKGLSELLALTELTELQRNYVGNIISSSNTLLGIINDVLDFSKIDADRMEFVEGKYRLAELITGLCNVVNLRADKGDVQLDIDAPPDLPTTLWGDEVHVKQILTNLLSNAVKYTKEGTVHFLVRVEKRGDGATLVCSVEDSGVGIREEDIPGLFDAFSRADLQTNRSIAGTGLGLAITKRLVDAMHGVIEVESVYGVGSIFTVRIPQKISDPSPIARVRCPECKRVLVLGQGRRVRQVMDLLKALGVDGELVVSAQPEHRNDWPGFTHCLYEEEEGAGQVNRLRPRMPGCRFAVLAEMRQSPSLTGSEDTVLYMPLFVTDLADFLEQDSQGGERGPTGNAHMDLQVLDTTILVVDDNEINLIVGGEMLRAFGAEVECASSGKQALELCGAKRYDIIFMDHMMPEMDGVETTQELRSIPGPNQKTPVVALTANVVNNMRSHYLQCGMDDFIGKPVEFRNLSQVLVRWLPHEKVEARCESISPEDLAAGLERIGILAPQIIGGLDGRYDAYAARVEQAAGMLESSLDRLKASYAERDWNGLSQQCGALESQLLRVGAVEHAGRLGSLAKAAAEGDFDRLHSDFSRLAVGLEVLGKKLETVRRYFRGDGGPVPVGCSMFLRKCLERITRALAEQDGDGAMAQLDIAAAHSLDAGLDAALQKIRTYLEHKDYAAAQKVNAILLSRHPSA